MKHAGAFPRAYFECFFLHNPIDSNFVVVSSVVKDRGEFHRRNFGLSEDFFSHLQGGRPQVRRESEDVSSAAVRTLVEIVLLFIH